VCVCVFCTTFYNSLVLARVYYGYRSVNSLYIGVYFCKMLSENELLVPVFGYIHLNIQLIQQVP
jgi:hypothetical protein